MPKNCFHCDLNNRTKHPNLSFYKFPDDISRRKSWFNALGREYDERRFIYLCSNHFSSNDCHILPNGLFRLKKTAIPCVDGLDSKFLDSTTVQISTDKNKCSSSVINDTCRREFLVSPIKESLPVQTENIHSGSSTITLTDPEHADIHSGSSTITVSDPESKFIRSGSSTITVTDPEHDIADLDSVKKIRPRYIGRCKKKFVEINEKDKKNWIQAIRTINDQRRKIRLLHQRKRRFKSKVSSLTSLLFRLQQKRCIFEKSTSITEATAPGSLSEIINKDSFEQLKVTEIFNGACSNIEFIFEESS